MSDLFVAKEGASFDDPNGQPVFINAGDIAREGNAVLMTHRYMFEPLNVKFDYFPPAPAAPKMAAKAPEPPAAEPEPEPAEEETPAAEAPAPAAKLRAPAKSTSGTRTRAS